MYRKILLLLFVLIATPDVLAEEFAVPDGIVYLEWHSDFSPQEKEKLKAWLTKATHVASQLSGKFPRAESRVVIERASRRRGSRWPVPWGQTIRRGMNGVLFQVNTEKPLQAYIGDWTAAHEFSHLFVPYPGQRDIWLSEGFASYYQNILMAREGIYNELQAWQKLYEGFTRAGADRNEDYTLNEISEGRRQHSATMRLYWSGALFFLEADIALRLASNNAVTLDWVVDEFLQCCNNYRRRLSGKDMLEYYDRVLRDKAPRLAATLGDHYFRELYQRYSQSHAIPNYEDVLSRVGISVRDKSVHLDGGHQYASVRRDMTQAKLPPIEVNP